MKTDNKIDIIEEAMKNSYNSHNNQYEVSSDWQSSVMSAIKKESNSLSIIDKKVISFTWFIAGIAAIFLLLSTIWIYQIEILSIDNDIENLYVDNSINEILMDNFE